MYFLQWLMDLLKKIRRKPKPPTKATLKQRSTNVADVKLSWSFSPSPGVTAYSVGWTLNGSTPPGTATVPATPSGDAAGYSRLFSDDNPGVALKNGDVVRASVAAFDAATGLFSPPIIPTQVTISIAPLPPAPPQNVTLSQV